MSRAETRSGWFSSCFREAQEIAIQGFISLHMWADFRKGLDDAAALQRLRAFILGEAPKSGPGDDPKVPKPEIEPYRGLDPFEGKHAIYFLAATTRDQGTLRSLAGMAVYGGHRRIGQRQVFDRASRFAD